jgi:hypothetical protein
LLGKNAELAVSRDVLLEIFRRVSKSNTVFLEKRMNLKP